MRMSAGASRSERRPGSQRAAMLAVLSFNFEPPKGSRLDSKKALTKRSNRVICTAGGSQLDWKEASFPHQAPECLVLEGLVPEGLVLEGFPGHV